MKRCNAFKHLFPFYASIFLTIAAIRAQAPELNWSRELVEHNDRSIPFQVVSTSFIGGHFSANCVYNYNDRRGEVELHGVRDSLGDFLPFVTYEARNAEKAKPKRLGEFSQQSATPISVRVNFMHPSELLHVNLDPFRSAIGAMRWGRLLLETGDVAEFDLFNLLPTGSAVDEAGNFRQEIEGDNAASTFRSSFALLRVTSFNRHLVGEFVPGPNREHLMPFDVSKSSEGDLWPNVTHQVGNSDGQWKSIGESVPPGERIQWQPPRSGSVRMLSVAMDAYKPYLSKFKYGRIQFSNRGDAVFELADLLPKP